MIFLLIQFQRKGKNDNNHDFAKYMIGLTIERSHVKRPSCKVIIVAVDRTFLSGTLPTPYARGGAKVQVCHQIINCRNHESLLYKTTEYFLNDNQNRYVQYFKSNSRHFICLSFYDKSSH